MKTSPSSGAAGRHINLSSGGRNSAPSTNFNKDAQRQTRVDSKSSLSGGYSPVQRYQEMRKGLAGQSSYMQGQQIPPYGNSPQAPGQSQTQPQPQVQGVNTQQFIANLRAQMAKMGTNTGLPPAQVFERPGMNDPGNSMYRERPPQRNPWAIPERQYPEWEGEQERRFGPNWREVFKQKAAEWQQWRFENPGKYGQSPGQRGLEMEERRAWIKAHNAGVNRLNTGGYPTF